MYCNIFFSKPSNTLPQIGFRLSCTYKYNIILLCKSKILKFY